MKVSLTKSFQKDALSLRVDERVLLFDVLLKLPKAVQNPKAHDGVGLRKIHPSGIFEARLGLSLRLVFGYRNDEILLDRVGNHDEIRRYLKTL
jgi:mRNA-degrading endonuclease YafQ of YafQ-DinJ toxin-antitoxin module